MSAVCSAVAGVCTALVVTGMILLVGGFFASLGEDELTAAWDPMIWLGFSLILGTGVTALVAMAKAQSHDKREVYHRELAEMPLVPDRCRQAPPSIGNA